MPPAPSNAIFVILFSPRSVFGTGSAVPHSAKKVGCSDLPTLECDFELGMGRIIRVRPAERRTGSNRRYGSERIDAELSGGMAGCIARRR